MKNILSLIKPVFSRPVVIAALLGVVAAVAPDIVAAQFYGGPGIVGGITHAEAIGGIATSTDIRDIILKLLLAVLLFMGLAAVVVIVIAGIYMVISVGDETAKEKAKKIITYAVIGLIIIAIAAGIVTIIINATGGGSIFGPVPDLGNTGGSDIRVVILNILDTILSFMALAAVVVIVIAGILMVVSLGDETAKDRAKRIIFYAVIGLVIILIASAIVRIVESSFR